MRYLSVLVVTLLLTMGVYSVMAQDKMTAPASQPQSTQVSEETKASIRQDIVRLKGQLDADRKNNAPIQKLYVTMQALLIDYSLVGETASSDAAALRKEADTAAINNPQVLKDGIPKDFPVTAMRKPSPLTKEVAIKKLEYLESLSRQGKSFIPTFIQTAQIGSAINDLRASPDTAGTPLTEALVDNSKDRSFRIICAQTLRESGASTTPILFPKLENIIRDAHDAPILRIYAAYFILRDNKKITGQMRSYIKRTSMQFMREGQEKTSVRMLLLPQFKDDRETQDFMISQLESKQDLGPTLATIGKMRSTLAVKPIKKLIGTHRKDKDFPLTRAYLALGQIGGDEAYKTLITCLNEEPVELERDMILRAIGLTKHQGAKEILIDYLRSKPVGYYTASLAGLAYLADPSTIPVLENELNRDLEPYLKQEINRTIQYINHGGREPEW